MVRTQISLDKELYSRAKRVARRHGVSFSELCRQGIAEIVAREGSNMPWMRYAGIVEGDIDDSVSVDQVVYGRERP